jgi:hypothetical protein
MATRKPVVKATPVKEELYAFVDFCNEELISPLTLEQLENKFCEFNEFELAIVEVVKLSTGEKYTVKLKKDFILTLNKQDV